MTRRRTPPRGISAWPEDEVTPPPVDVPLLPIEDAPADLREQIALLTRGVNEAKGLAYETRLASHRLERIERNVGTIATTITRHQTLLDENLAPQLDQWRATTDGIARELPGVLGKLDHIGETIDRFDRRLRDIEVSMRVSVERLTAANEAVVARVAAVEVKATDTALRVIELEKREHGRDQHARALAKTERRKTTAWAGALSAIAGAATWLAQHLWK